MQDGLEAPHFIDSDDCQGNPEQYWRCWGWHQNVPVACGVGATPEQATQMASARLQKYKENLSKSPQEQLKLLLEKKRLLHDDLEKAVQLIGMIILTNKPEPKQEEWSLNEWTGADEL